MGFFSLRIRLAKGSHGHVVLKTAVSWTRNSTATYQHSADVPCVATLTESAFLKKRQVLVYDQVYNNRQPWLCSATQADRMNEC